MIYRRSIAAGVDKCWPVSRERSARTAPANSRHTRAACSLCTDLHNTTSRASWLGHTDQSEPWLELPDAGVYPLTPFVSPEQKSKQNC